MDEFNRSHSRLPDVELSTYLEDLMLEWCLQIESYLEDNDQSRYDAPDSGPDTEIEFWKRRMQKLTSITEQMKAKECKQTVAILTSISKNGGDQYNKTKILALLRRWKRIDVGITEAANEAKDNVKYLTSLENFIDPLYNGNPTTIIDALPALLNSVKMIHTIARYYSTTERMTNLFVKITNQMINNCKKSILRDQLVDRLWENNMSELVRLLQVCFYIQSF